jgi:AbrB family looped-hinge helix DNA binding protein
VKATITKRGQVSIPAKIRQEMQLEPGHVVTFERISATECRLIIELRPAIKPDPLAAIGFAQRHGLPAMRTEEWMGLLREGDAD